MIQLYGGPGDGKEIEPRGARCALKFFDEDGYSIATYIYEQDEPFGPIVRGRFSHVVRS